MGDVVIADHLEGRVAAVGEVDQPVGLARRGAVVAALDEGVEVMRDDCARHLLEGAFHGACGDHALSIRRLGTSVPRYDRLTMTSAPEPIDVRSVLRAALVQSSDPVPFNVRELVEALGRAADILVRRGWEIDDIDESGVGFLWPPSWVPEELHYDDMESPMTILTVWSSLGVGYVLAGVPTLWTYPDLSINDVVTESAALVEVEAHRWTTPPPRRHPVVGAG